MPKLRTESWAADDFSWLGSAHGIWNARTVTLDISAFTEATHYPDGFIPSGTPLGQLASGLYAPYDETEATTTGAGILAGFLFGAAKVHPGLTEDIPAALLDHGRVVVANLPITFVAPTAEAKRAATTIVFI